MCPSCVVGGANVGETFVDTGTRMVIYSSPALRVDSTNSLPVQTGRLTPPQERTHQTQPLMRKFEIAVLCPNGATRTSHHLAPATELFEATSSALARGTLISTANGPIAIEDLIPGDEIDTVNGDAQPVIWIGSTSFTSSQVIPETSLTGMIRLIADGYSKSGALGDLMLGANARLLQSRPSLQQLIGVNAVLTPVRDLDDGHTAFMVTPPSPVRLYHIRLANHAAIYANGRPVETYHPGKGVEELLGENMRALFLSLFPDVECFSDFGSLAYLRMSKETLDSLT
jgi:hypothetical protein